jgi:hypothetical protein
MSKQHAEFKESRGVANFSRLFVYAGAIMILAIYMAAPFDYAPRNLQGWATLANVLTLAFLGMGFWGLSKVKGKKDLGVWLFYGLIFLLAAASFILSLMVYL